MDKLIAVEIKYSDNPSLSKGFYNVLEDLSINKTFVITPGTKPHKLDEKIAVSGLQYFLEKLKKGSLIN